MSSNDTKDTAAAVKNRNDDSFAANGDSADNTAASSSARRRKRRWGDAVPSSSEATEPPKKPATTLVLDSKAKALALQESVRARLAALKAKKSLGTVASKTTTTTTTTATSVSSTSTATTNANTAAATSSSRWKRPASSVSTEEGEQDQSASTTAASMKKRAKVYELDMSVTAPTFQKQQLLRDSKKTPVKVNPYLAHRTQKEQKDAAAKKKFNDMDNEEQLQKDDDDNQDGTNKDDDDNDDDDDNNNADMAVVDERLVRSSKPRQRNKALRFVEPGTFIEIAERKRYKALNAEQSGFASGRKAGMYFQSSNMASIYGSGGAADGTDDAEDHDVSRIGLRAEAQEKTTFPQIMEWWDMELLPSKLKKQVASYEGKVLSKQTKSQMMLMSTANTTTTTTTTTQDDDTKSTTEQPPTEGLSKEPTSSLLKQDVLDLQQRCYQHASLSYSKTAALIQHIVPIKPAWASAMEQEVQPTLYLTKRELKRQRKLRRQKKQLELQDLQAAGLVAPPEPRLTLKNFIRVMGDQAYVDPSKMEQKVMEQIQARQRAHLERNEKSKLSKEQRAAKLAKKLQEDTTLGVHVSVFYVKDMSHRYHRAKVDLNAQQYNITGGVLECMEESTKLACVICEGGPKAIKRFQRLMLVRMKWTGGPENEFDDDDDIDVGGGNYGEEQDPNNLPKRQKFNPDNKCELVWHGMAAKRFFKGFVFQACETSEQARNVLKEKGVAHYWDQVLTHASGRGDTFQLKLLADDDDGDDEDNYYGGRDNSDMDKEDEDIVMVDQEN